MFWLLKTEPESYSFADLQRLGRDRWNGVRNFKALHFMREMAPGDLAFIYHTGKEKAIVGVGEVVTKAYPDPEALDPRFVVFDLVPRYRLNNPVSLKAIKNAVSFNDWQLVREPRLSVMPVSPEHWRQVLQMAEQQLPLENDQVKV